MRAVGNHRGARTISLAFVAGILAFEAGLLLASGAVGIPGVLLVRVADGGAVAHLAPGGESVAVKTPQSASPVLVAPAERQEAPRIVDAHDLEGLNAIPQDTDWQNSPDVPQPKAFDANAKGREELPWDQVEPVPLDPVGAGDGPAPIRPVAAGLPSPPSLSPLAGNPKPPIKLPDSGVVESWIKAKATELKGADRKRPIYHLELWLEPPAALRKRLVAVAYDFSTPAVLPQSQVSHEKETGFRARFGGLACADKITVTLKFDDGRSQRVALDGCGLFG